MGNRHPRPVIASTPYPLYCVRMLGPRHLLVGGGGGSAKTGVINRLDIFLFEFDGHGEQKTLNLVRTGHMDTGSAATMNLDLVQADPKRGHFIIACGQDDFCRLYKSQFDVAFFRNGQLDVEAASDRATGDKNAKLNGHVGPQVQASRKLTYALSEQTNFKSDFAKKISFQKVVRIDPSKAKFVATGGADGSFRVWDSSSGEKLTEVEAHTGDIDDMDISPDGCVLVTVGHDAKTHLWRTQDGQRLTELYVPPEIAATGLKYRIRLCRFTRLGVKNHVFVSAFIPIERSSKNQQSFLTLWAYSQERNILRPLITKPVFSEVVSALAVSADGGLTAAGTLEGSVFILDSHTFEVMKAVRSTHGIFCTGVEFLPPLPTRDPDNISLGFAADHRAAVVSISADQTVQLHLLPWKNESSLTGFMIWLGLIAVIVYFIMRFIGL